MKAKIAVAITGALPILFWLHFYVTKFVVNNARDSSYFYWLLPMLLIALFGLALCIYAYREHGRRLGVIAAACWMANCLTPASLLRIGKRLF